MMAVTSAPESETVVASSQGVDQTMSPGNNPAGSRMSDSENLKTCHQCRQRTRDYVESCKTMKKDKRCLIKYCRKCLLNRYGEKLDEVKLLDHWICPKCRDNCNCSVCMKKKGYKPTGILVQKARKTGFSSVSEMLQVKGLEDLHAITKKDSAASSPLKDGNGNSFHGDCDPELQSMDLAPNSEEKKSKKIKREGSQEFPDCSKEYSNNAGVSEKEKPELSEEGTENTNIDQGVSNGVEAGAKLEASMEPSKAKKCLPIIELPQGTSLVTVAGIDLPPTDIGHALQFLEFCAAFGEVIDIKKGQAECVIREIMRGRSRSQLPYSSISQIHIQLLSLIQRDMGKKFPSLSSDEKDSWVKALGQCLSESRCAPKELPSDTFPEDVDGYNMMDSSLKLKLLNFLCDEALNTMTLRNGIENKLSQFDDRKKEVQEKILLAKNKEKDLTNEIQGKLAEAVIAKEGALLLDSEHDAIVGNLQIEVAQARREIEEAKGLLPKNRQRVDALRNQPILLDAEGRAFYRLKSYNREPDILCQDLASLDVTVADDKWFVFEADQKNNVEKYISTLRKKRYRTRKVLDKNSSPSAEINSDSE